MRGKVPVAVELDFAIRITPAYAGKSRSVYPHTILIEGSPPPMRGKGKISSYLVRSSGITPAYAGKSFGDDDSEESLKDHPRLCGEKLLGGIYCGNF